MNRRPTILRFLISWELGPRWAKSCSLWRPRIHHWLDRSLTCKSDWCIEETRDNGNEHGNDRVVPVREPHLRYKAKPETICFELVWNSIFFSVTIQTNHRKEMIPVVQWKQRAICIPKTPSYSENKERTQHRLKTGKGRRTCRILPSELAPRNPPRKESDLDLPSWLCDFY